MGTSTDAIIYYGFDFYDPEMDASIPQWILDLESTDQDMDACDAVFLWKDYYARIKNPKVSDEEIEKQEFLVDINYHQSHEYPVYFIHIKRFYKRARRGWTQTLDTTEFKPTDQELEQLKEVCQVLGIEWQEPKAYLASYWG